MSDPYAGTVTVRNILNHIISPKIVNDGYGGYTTKVDLVNVDKIVFGSGTGTGTSANPFTGQCGRIQGNGAVSLRVYHQNVSTTSIILVSKDGDALVYIEGVVCSNGSFYVNFSAAAYSTISWFIVKF